MEVISEHIRHLADHAEGGDQNSCNTKGGRILEYRRVVCVTDVNSAQRLSGYFSILSHSRGQSKPLNVWA